MSKKRTQYPAEVAMAAHLHIQQLKTQIDDLIVMRDKLINQKYPVGTRLRVAWRHDRIMLCDVAFDCHAGRLRVLSRTGLIHHVDYSQVEGLDATLQEHETYWQGRCEVLKPEST